MKLSTPEIVWHSKEPIFTADFHRNGPKWRLATGGADNDVKIWKVLKEEGGVKIVFLSSLSRHTKAVNVVRFSPNGEYLASAGDDNVLFLWSSDQGSGPGTANLLTHADPANKEYWTVVKILRGHLEDIYDLSWSRDSSYIITGSVDNSAIIWDVQKGQQVSMLKESRQYVQGVAWDPLGKFVVTLSNDRNLRVYGIESKFKCLHSITKLSLPDQDGHSKQCRMWIDERLNSFFRRLSFTPDGSFLIAPAGSYEFANQSKNASYVFARNNWSRPVLQLPGPEKPTVVAKCSPVPFKLKQESGPTLTSLPYRVVYAVASLDSVLFYDTQHSAPFAHVSNIHYSGITDITWSIDGLMLVVTSSDCYCSVITFEPNELGDPLDVSVMFPSMKDNNKAEQLVRPSKEDGSHIGCQDNVSDVNGTTASPSVATQYEQAVSPGSKPRRIRPTMISGTTSISSPDKSVDSKSSDSTSTPPEVLPAKAVAHETINTGTTEVVPRRVDFITLSSFKNATSSISSRQN